MFLHAYVFTESQKIKKKENKEKKINCTYLFM